MANTVSFILQLQDRFSRQAEKIRSSVKRAVSSFDGFNRKIKKVSLSLKKLGKTTKEIGEKVKKFGETLSKKVTLPIIALGTASLFQSAKIETLAVGFETMTGSAEKGQKLLNELTRFTATTPFQLEGVAKATKTLLAFRVPLEKIPKTLRLLGDIAAGTDAPLSDIALIFGKARAKGKLMTEELLQLAERGIPIIDLLAESFGGSKEAVFKMASESKLSFELMQNALVKMTSKGGIFFDQTTRQSATLGGMFSTLKDNILLTLAIFGDIVVDVFGLKKGLSGLNASFEKLRDRIKAFAKERPVLTKFIVIALAVTAALGPLLIIAGNLFIVFGVMAFAAGALGLTFSAILLPILGIVAAIGLMIAAGVLIVNNWAEIKEGALLLSRDVFDFFSRMLEPLIAFDKAIIAFVLTPINKVRDIISGIGAAIGSTIGSALSFNDVKIESNQSLTQKTQATVDVNIRAPDGVIESVNKSVNNSKAMNIGLNVAPAGA